MKKNILKVLAVIILVQILGVPFLAEDIFYCSNPECLEQITNMTPVDENKKYTYMNNEKHKITGAEFYECSKCDALTQLDFLLVENHSGNIVSESCDGQTQTIEYKCAYCNEIYYEYVDCSQHECLSNENPDTADIDFVFIALAVVSATAGVFLLIKKDNSRTF